MEKNGFNVGEAQGPQIEGLARRQIIGGRARTGKELVYEKLVASPTAIQRVPGQLDRSSLEAVIACPAGDALNAGGQVIEVGLTARTGDRHRIGEPVAQLQLCRPVDRREHDLLDPVELGQRVEVVTPRAQQQQLVMPSPTRQTVASVERRRGAGDQIVKLITYNDVVARSQFTADAVRASHMQMPPLPNHFICSFSVGEACHRPPRLRACRRQRRRLPCCLFNLNPIGARAWPTPAFRKTPHPKNLPAAASQA